MADSKEESSERGKGFPVGAIAAFPFTTPPPNWLPCDGKTSTEGYPLDDHGLPGHVTPNLGGLVIVGAGQSPISGKTYPLNHTGGEEQHKLTQQEMPKHTHSVNISPTTMPQSGSTTQCLVPGNSNTAPAGEGAPHNSMQPYLVLNFFIYAGRQTQEK